MDDIVRAAMRKWPNVPDCYGWLALDARGTWYMRDERIQAAGPFPAVKGSAVRHEKLLAFIHRNYGLDDQGAACFQNGPQRVYVELEVAPYVWRLQETAQGLLVAAHTGEPAGAVKQALVDEHGHLYLETALGFGLVHSLDMWSAARAVDEGRWAPQEAMAAQLPARFGYVLRPSPAAA